MKGRGRKRRQSPPSSHRCCDAASSDKPVFLPPKKTGVVIRTPRPDLGPTYWTLTSPRREASLFNLPGPAGPGIFLWRQRKCAADAARNLEPCDPAPGLGDQGIAESRFSLMACRPAPPGQRAQFVVADAVAIHQQPDDGIFQDFVDRGFVAQPGLGGQVILPFEPDAYTTLSPNMGRFRESHLQASVTFRSPARISGPGRKKKGRSFASAPVRYCFRERLAAYIKRRSLPSRPL